MPHVSLVYGIDFPSRKLEIISALPPEVRTSFLVKSVTLIQSRQSIGAEGLARDCGVSVSR